ncbi:MAG: diguanylate cyclase, partial [Campylobacterota bacterium]|nr:diguanylate cyclase [Campylobacterota bacterium]
MLFRFARSFILLLLFLGVMTTVSFYLYKKYEETTLQIHKIIYDDLIDDQGQLFENYIAYLQDDMGDKIISNFKKYPMIRAHYERDLANLLTDEVKYLYVLYFDGDKLRYLIDTEKDPQERADINQKFDPQSSIWIDAKNQKKPQTLVQKNLESLWVSYAHPIIVNDKVVAVLGADFSYDEFQTIEEAVAPLNRLFLYMSIFMLMMLLSAYIQFYLYYKTRKRSLIDPLTNVYNRQYLMDFLQDSVINHYQIMMIDLDHFKNVNDHYGHDIGDKVLKKATQRIAKTIRNNDVLIRFGGEEFLLF